MYIKLDEDLYKKIQTITITDYDAKGDFIPVESIPSMLEDLLYEIEHLEEKYEDLEQDLRDNYRPLTLAEQSGMSDRDFL